MTDRVDGYAAALYELARAEGELAKVERDFYAIARGVETSPELRDALTDPRLPLDRKQAIVDDLVDRKASHVTINLINLLIRQGRASDLPDIADRLAAQVAAAAGKEVAEVRTAVELDETTVERLAAALSKAVGRPVEVRVIIDPSVVGGVVARVGDRIFDGSVRRRLESLREAFEIR